MTDTSTVTLEERQPLTVEERHSLTELAFDIGAKYAGRRFSDTGAGAEHWEDVCAAGLPALSLPPEYGGGGNMGDLLLVAERLAAGGYPASKLTISTAVSGAIITRHGTEQQKNAWLPGIADGSLNFCFGLTEPGAGSNAARMSTKATRTPSGWRISGQKTYISAVNDSDMMLLVAKDEESGGLSLFALELPCEQLTLQKVGVMVGVPEHQWSVFFDDVELPAEALIGAPGEGSRPLFDGLNPERLIVAAQAVGIGRWCLSRGTDYARERVVFGVPIGTHQAVQNPLAEALIELEAAWALVERGAAAYEENVNAGLACNMAKVKACDAGLQAADSSLQAFGGSGFTDETLMFERFGYLRLLRSVPVARELALSHIAVSGLDLPRSY